MSRLRTLAVRAPLWTIMLAAACPGIASAQTADAPQPATTAPIETVAQADPAPQLRTNPPAEADPTQGTGQEIVVTAQKRSERLLDVPQSVTALSSADLAKYNATQFRDYANTIPGLQFTTSGAGQSQISIRGVTTGLTGATTVGVYVDEVPYGSSNSYADGALLSLDLGLFDLDRVEILRGPQGTLYGASAMGGVIKYVTPLPDTDEVEGLAQAGISTTRHGGIGYNAAAAINVPIATDKAAVRASGYFSRDGGFIDNVALDRDDVDRSRTYGGRLDLLLTPTDRLRIRFTGAGQNISRRGLATADYNLDGEPAFGSLEQFRILNEPFEQRFRLVSGTVNYDFDGFGLTSVTSYQTVKSERSLDFSSLYVPLLNIVAGLNLGSTEFEKNVDTRKFTQEVRLASTNQGRLEWLVGGFFTRETSDNEQILRATNPDGSPFPLLLADGELPTTYREIAGFGNLTFHVTDKLELSGGIRYARNKQKFKQTDDGLLLGTFPEARSHESVTTYLANAKYEFSRNAQAYLRFATGYRPGGPNAVAADPATGEPLAPPTFESDKLQSYEAGFKAQTPDRRLAIDIAAYYIDWNNIQIATARNGIAVIANADAGARVYGSDATMTFRPTQDFNMTAAVGLIDARLSGDEPDLGGRKDERLPDVPRLTAALTADYAFADVAYRPRIGATVRYIADREASFDASPNFRQYDLGDYTSVDLRAGASFGPLDAQLYVRNLFDKRGQLSASTLLSALGAPAQVAILQPRTIGLSLTTRF